MKRFVRGLRAGLWLPVVVLCACGDGAGHSGGGKSGPLEVLDADTWWTRSTTRTSGEERILAPRELRALMAEGKANGFDRDADWWNKRRTWVAERVLALDPEDVESNLAMGRRTLQRYENFESLWNEMLSARAPNQGIEELLDQYDGDVQEGRPVFLGPDEWEVVTARLTKVGQYLDKLRSDPKYAKLQTALSQVRRDPLLSAYPFVHIVEGPFLVFFTARDLQRIPGENPAEEDVRIAGRKQAYGKYLERLRGVYAGVLTDMRRLFPELGKYHALTEQSFFPQWIFAETDIGSYRDYAEKTRKENAERANRVGYFNAKTRWAFLYEWVKQEQPPDDGNGAGGQQPLRRNRGDDPTAETAAYLAALQILEAWGLDAQDRTVNHMQNSRALWLREGLASELAARRVKEPAIGQQIQEAHRFRVSLPRSAASKVVQCGSWYTIRLYQEPIEPVEEGQARPMLLAAVYPDLAWLLFDTLLQKRYREKLVRFLEGQIDGSGGNGGIKTFEKTFGIQGEAGWAALELDLLHRWDVRSGDD